MNERQNAQKSYSFADQVQENLNSLRNEVAQLETVDVRTHIKNAVNYVRTEINERPYMTLASAAAVGFGFGFLSSKQAKSAAIQVSKLMVARALLAKSGD